jgi:hypothetical protein
MIPLPAPPPTEVIVEKVESEPLAPVEAPAPIVVV